MGLASQIKPISYLKANAAEIVRTMHERGEPLIITQNGEAKAVLLDIHEYEQTQETMALLKILAMAEAEIARGDIMPLDDAIKSILEEE